MGLLQTLIKAIGGAALELAIENACANFEQFVHGIQFNKDFVFNYSWTFKGIKRPVGISIKVRKTKKRVSYKISGLSEQSFELSNLSDGCKTAINTAINLL